MAAKISRDEFKEDAIICTIDDEKCCSYWNCNDCEKAKKEMMSLADTILPDLMPSIPRSDTNPRLKGLVNQYNIIIKFRKGEDPFENAKVGINEYNVIATPEEMRIPEIYPEFDKLRKYAGLGEPSYYLLKNHKWPMLAVYVTESEECYYLVAPVSENPQKC